MHVSSYSLRLSLLMYLSLSLSFFLFNDTATTEIYTLSLHDALPISGLSEIQTVPRGNGGKVRRAELLYGAVHGVLELRVDRKSTRLNSSHQIISYAVFCLKKKKTYK